MWSMCGGKFNKELYIPLKSNPALVESDKEASLLVLASLLWSIFYLLVNTLSAAFSSANEINPHIQTPTFWKILLKPVVQ